MTYTERINNLRNEAVDELKRLLNAYGFGKHKTLLISDECEELIAERMFAQYDFPVALTMRSEMRAEWFVLTSDKYKSHKEIAIDATDDLCILADYLKNLYENN